MKSIALLWNRGMRPLSIIACLVLEHKGKSRSSALTGNSDWTGSWGDLGGVWHLALPFDEYFRKFWYPHLQWFQRSTDNCGKIHVRIILGHPIHIYYYTFFDQLWTICMGFGKSATNFEIPAAESCPNGRRTAEPPKLPALLPRYMHCRLNWPEKVLVLVCRVMLSTCVSTYIALFSHYS